jgi:hypothetical protein
MGGDPHGASRGRRCHSESVEDVPLLLGEDDDPPPQYAPTFNRPVSGPNREARWITEKAVPGAMTMAPHGFPLSQPCEPGMRSSGPQLSRTALSSARATLPDRAVCVKRQPGRSQPPTARTAK